ncbi:MAG: hypothetical protein C0627_00210 [Sulfurimonas sp.]|nr:MAG: hypothetical protein C0627_00210 [Sulfurimonas sp.]
MAVTRQQVAELYVATFNRAPDAAGLDYWVNDSGLTIEEIAQSFFDQPETQTLYPTGTTDTAFVTSIYTNLFNRAPDADGLAYWVADLTAGTSRSVMIEAMKNGAIGTDATIIANKATVGLYVADTLGLNLTDFSLSAVTDDAATVTTVQATADTYVPQTFTLTTGTETITGTANNDTINGVVSTLTSAKTFDTTDIVDGGEGTDTFNITLNSGHTGMTGTGAVSNVENINLTNAGTVARTFDTTGITGVTKYNIDATTGLVNLTDLASTPEVALSNYTNTGSFSTAFATGAAELTGATDAITFTISGLGTVEDTTTTAVEQKVVTATLTDIETVNINATGDNVIALAGTDMKALTVAGAGNVNVTSVATTTTSFDGSASTGNITVDTTNTAATLTSISTGSGNDAVTFDEVDGSATTELIGGAGTDTLTLNSNGGVVQYAMSGFETVALGTVCTAALTMSGTNTSDLTTISTKSTVTQNVSLVNMGAIDLTVNSLGDTDTASTISSNHTGSTVLNYTADAASVTAKTAQTPDGDLSFSGSAALTVNVGAYIDQTTSDITAAAATSLVVNVASGKDAAATPAELTVFGSDVTVAEATSIEVNATGKITGANIIAAKAKSATITNGANAATLDIDGALIETLTVTSGKAFDASGSTLTGVQVADLTANDGVLDFNGEALSALSSLTVAGSGVTNTTAGTTASSADFGTLGGDNAYNLSITATGLKGGFDAGTVNTGAGYDITIDGSGIAAATAATNALVIGAIGGVTEGANVTVTTAGTAGVVNLSTIDATGTVTLTNSSTGTFDVGDVDAAAVAIDTSNTTGAVTIANVTSTGALTLTNTGTGDYTQTGAISAGITGDVTIDMQQTVGDISIGTVAGKTVSVDLSGTVASTTSPVLGDITAHTGATLKTYSLDNNTEKIIASTTSTALAVALTGAAGYNDAITIEDGAASNSITVTGDLKTGTNSITIDADASTTATTMAINISGLSNYTTGTINVAGAAAAGTTQTITGGAKADTITFEVANTLTAADTVTGGASATGTVDTLVIESTSLVDNSFTNVTGIETLQMAGAASDITLGAQAVEAGITTVTGLAGVDDIDASAYTAALTINSAAGADIITAATAAVTTVTWTGNADINTIATSAITSAGYFNLTGFTAASDLIDFNGAVSSDDGTATTVNTNEGADMADLASIATGVVYAHMTGAMTAGIVNEFIAGTKTLAELKAAAIVAMDDGSGAAGVTAGLDTALADGSKVLVSVFDDEDTTLWYVSNVAAGGADTILAAELELVGVIQGDLLNAAEFATSLI